jgi:hypothetical protein
MKHSQNESKDEEKSDRSNMQKPTIANTYVKSLCSFISTGIALQSKCSERESILLKLLIRKEI